MLQERAFWNKGSEEWDSSNFLSTFAAFRDSGLLNRLLLGKLHFTSSGGHRPHLCGLRYGVVMGGQVPSSLPRTLVLPSLQGEVSGGEGWRRAAFLSLARAWQAGQRFIKCLSFT